MHNLDNKCIETYVDEVAAAIVIPDMPYKRLLIILIISLVAITLVQWLFSYAPAAVHFYATNIFHPFQVVRNVIFGFIPFSLGDVVYIAVTLLIISLIVKWIYYLTKLKVYKRPLLLSLLKTAMAAAIVYLWFFIGWGGNYSKPSISEHWRLDSSNVLEDDSALIAFDIYLIGKMNEYAPLFKSADFRDIEKRSHQYYKLFPAVKDRLSSIRIKPAIFGNLLEYSGVHGYYNPFTGEGQINKNLPSFLLPFSTCHEMAHQAGIAREGDANFLSFIIGTNSNDPTFIYSAYFNIWLYTNARLRSRDSAVANSFYKDINGITMGHIYELRARRKKYESPVDKISDVFYDNFLKFNKQESGMESYSDVVNIAYIWEQKRLRGDRSPVSIP